MNTLEGYLVGDLLFDSDEQLFYRKIGLNNSEKTLIYTVWGKTEQEVDENSQKIIFLD